MYKERRRSVREEGRKEGRRTGCIQNEYPHTEEWWEKKGRKLGNLE